MAKIKDGLPWRTDGGPAGILGLDGRTGHEAGKALDVAIRNMEERPDRAVLATLQERWKGLARWQVIQTRPCVTMAQLQPPGEAGKEKP
jgi:hypothetical protein